MESYFEKIVKTLQLLETIEEALTYIQVQVSELRYEEAFILLEDSVSGVLSIDRVLKSLELRYKALKNNKIKEIKDKLDRYINNFAKHYFNVNHVELERIILLIKEEYLHWEYCINCILKRVVVN